MRVIQIFGKSIGACYPENSAFYLALYPKASYNELGGGDPGDFQEENL